jgi:ribonuclease-3
MRGKDLAFLCENIGYRFNDYELLKTAMTHTSYVNEAKEKCCAYERLEFLGDALLQIIISDELFRRFPDYGEGELSEARKHLVCENTLAEVAKKLSLQEYILLGNGEENTGGREKKTILADVFEALVAAVYLDSGKNIQTVADFLLPLIPEELNNCMRMRDGDYKTELNRIVEQDGLERLSYVVTERRVREDNSTIFVVNAKLNSNTIGTGIGKKIKDAENQAAKQALILFGFYSENEH